jgi:hypothetical protein
MRLVHDAPIVIPDQVSPGPGRVTRGERVVPDLFNVVASRLQEAEFLLCVVEGIGVEIEITAADSEDRCCPVRMPGPDPLFKARTG